MRVLLVALGGAIGSMLRLWASGLAQGAVTGSMLGGFPVGTLTVNTVGCLVIGALAELADERGYLSADARALLVVGLLGGFTTFSTFANETVTAWRSGSVLVPVGNVLVSVVLCLAAVAVGRGMIVAMLK